MRLVPYSNRIDETLIIQLQDKSLQQYLAFTFIRNIQTRKIK